MKKIIWFKVSIKTRLIPLDTVQGAILFLLILRIRLLLFQHQTMPPKDNHKVLTSAILLGLATLHTIVVMQVACILTMHIKLTCLIHRFQCSPSNLYLPCNTCSLCNTTKINMVMVRVINQHTLQAIHLHILRVIHLHILQATHLHILRVTHQHILLATHPHMEAKLVHHETMRGSELNLS